MSLNLKPQVVISAGVDSPNKPPLFGRWKWEVMSSRQWECRGFAFTRWGAERKANRILRRIERRYKAAE